MGTQRSALLRESLTANRITQFLIPLCALVAVVLGLLALHSLGTTHVQSAGAETSTPAIHDHAASSPSAPEHVANTFLVATPEGLTAPECPVGGLDCCLPMAACVMVLALLSVSLAIGVVPLVVIGVLTLSAVAAIIVLRQAPIRPPSPAALSVFRI